ncbi:hypothetical protein B0O80DRAFT_453577 [Mortierella sp. GBAus27b]|nr:hypothetical protein B0O80DRAFT_453577 [Mortierella sp. GBAus27b]
MVGIVGMVRPVAWFLWSCDSGFLLLALPSTPTSFPLVSHLASHLAPISHPHSHSPAARPGPHSSLLCARFIWLHFSHELIRLIL